MQPGPRSPTRTISPSALPRCHAASAIATCSHRPATTSRQCRCCPSWPARPCCNDRGNSAPVGPVHGACSVCLAGVEGNCTSTGHSYLQSVAPGGSGGGANAETPCQHRLCCQCSRSPPTNAFAPTFAAHLTSASHRIGGWDWRLPWTLPECRCASRFR
jgi:hypothetical protein